MIWATPETTIEVSLSGAPTGLVGTIGVRVVDGAGATTIARTTTGIVEHPAGSGIYTATLVSPSIAGQYLVVWDTGSVSPSTTATDELTVTTSTPATGSPVAGSLTTLTAVREFLQKPGTDQAQDDLIENLITRASRVLQNRFGREWAPTNDSERAIPYRGGGDVVIAPYDLRTVTAVSYDADGDAPVALTSDRWRLREADTANGVYRLVRLLDYTRDNRAGGRFEEKTIAITGDWGFPSVPADVEHACIVTVAAWLRRDVAAFSTTFSIDEGRLDRPEAIPAAVARALDHYRLPTVPA